MGKSKELSKKYEEIRKTIEANVAAIRALLEQADNLTAIIDETADPQLKDRLSESVRSLYGSIDSLVEQSNKLFDQYVDFANTVAD